MIKRLVFLLISCIVLFASLVVFLKSPYFLNLLEEIAGRSIGGSVEIGSLSFENMNALTVTGLVIKGGGGFNLTVPRLTLSFRPRDLLRRHLGEIVLTGPDLSITVSKEKAPKRKEALHPLPFTLDTLSFIDGRVYIHDENGRTFQVRPVNLSLEMDRRTGRTSLKADALLNDLNSEISAEAIIDMETLSVESAQVHIPAIELEMLSSLPFFAFLQEAGLQGTAGLELQALPQNADSDHTLITAALSVRGLSARTDSLQVTLGERLLNLSFKGGYQRGHDRIDIDTLRVEVSHLGPWTAAGTLERVLSGNPDLNLTITGTGAALKEISAMVSGPAVEWLHKIPASGLAGADISVTGSLRSPEAHGMFTASGDGLKAGNIVLHTVALSLPLEYRRGSLIIKNASAAVRDLVTAPGGNNETSLSVHNLKLLLPWLEFREREIKAGAFQLTAEKASVMTGKKEYLTEKGIILKGSITGNAEDRQLRFENLALDTDNIKNAAAWVSVRMVHPASVKAALDYDDIDIEQLARAIAGGFFQSRGLRVSGRGTLHAGGTITFPEKGGPYASGTLEMHLKNGGFSSADETVIAEGINADLSGRFAFPPSVDSIDFSVSSEASGFELVAGRFYGAFSDRGIHCQAEGRYTFADHTLTIVRSMLGLAGIGDLLMTGTVTSPGRGASVDMNLKIPELSNSEAFDFFLRETFGEQYPFLSQMHLGGQTSADLSVSGTVEKFTAQGDLRITAMDVVDLPSGNSVTGVNISLPFDISFPEAGPVQTMDRFGSFVIGDITWPPLHVSGFAASAAVGGNTFVFKDDITIPLYGGSVTLKKVSYRDILSPQRNLRLAAAIEGIDLAEVGKAIDMPGFSGSLKGTIPSASFAENRLVTEGEITLELFDGTIRVTDFSADNVFSPIASVRSNIEMYAINLGTLSRTFEFGHISGMMRGELKDLVIVNGQAQRFQGYLETYRKKGVDQRISVEALKKISILGTGTSASVLDRGIYQFFRDYRYDKIGFRAALRNDNLVLMGVGDENDSKYLVKGGLLPPKVDVITYNQNISFKELLSRLSRISQIERTQKR